MEREGINMDDVNNIVVGSPMNHNTLLYGDMTDEMVPKNFGPSCVDMQGEKVDVIITKNEEI